MGEKEEPQPLFGIGGMVIVWVWAAIIWFVMRYVVGWDWFKATAIDWAIIWMAFFFLGFENWPFNKIKQPFQGIIVAALCHIFGVLHWYVLEWIGWDPNVYLVPILCNLFFLMALSLFCLDNEYMANVKQPAKGILNNLLWYMGAIVLALWAPMGGIPAHWFPWGLIVNLGFGKYMLRGMKQPSKGIMQLALWVFGIMIYTIIMSIFFGIQWGTNQYFIWYGVWDVWCFTWFVYFMHWPWRKLGQPWNGIIGAIVSFISTAIWVQILLLFIPWEEISVIGFAANAAMFMLGLNINYGFPKCFKYIITWEQS